MARSSKRMQKATRCMRTTPRLLRPHPLTTDALRICRTAPQTASTKQAPDRYRFHLARAKLRAEQGCRARPFAHSASWCASTAMQRRPARALTVWRAPSRGRAIFPRAHPKSKQCASSIGPTHGGTVLAGCASAPVIRRGPRRTAPALARAPNYRPLHYAYVEVC